MKTRASRKTDPSRGDAAAQVRAYLAALPAPARKRMLEMRRAILAAAPRAVEHFSYRIPAFRLNDQPLVWYAAFQRHTSLFPMTGRIREAYAKELEGYKTAKGTVQFPLDAPLPVGLVKKLVRARAAETR
jgi:uncharacterized protein YdhG (YjbR/CyaY superfamily)